MIRIRIVYFSIILSLSSPRFRTQRLLKIQEQARSLSKRRPPSPLGRRSFYGGLNPAPEQYFLSTSYSILINDLMLSVCMSHLYVCR